MKTSVLLHGSNSRLAIMQFWKIIYSVSAGIHLSVANISGSEFCSSEVQTKSTWALTEFRTFNDPHSTISSANNVLGYSFSLPDNCFSALQMNNYKWPVRENLREMLGMRCANWLLCSALSLPYTELKYNEIFASPWENLYKTPAQCSRCPYI